MLLKEIKALKTVAGRDRFGNNIAGADKFDERRVYIVDTNMKPLENFMNMEAATRAVKNSPKKFVKGEFHIKTGKELNKLCDLREAEKDVPRDFYGKPLRGVQKELALAARKKELQDIRSGKPLGIKDNMIGVAKSSVSEEALETKTAEDMWTENSDAIASYVSTALYQVRPLKNTNPTKYEAFSVLGETKKFYGEFTAAELKRTLKPIRPNQTPDAEGFTTYTDPVEIEAFKYSGDPVKVALSDKETAVLNKGDYLTRTVKGSHFEYDFELASDFEAMLKKA